MFPRFPHLVFVIVKVSTPCQGFHTLSRFPRPVSVLVRFFHFVNVLIMVPTQIHLTHILFFMFLTWGNVLGFIFFPI